MSKFSGVDTYLAFISTRRVTVLECLCGNVFGRKLGISDSYADIHCPECGSYEIELGKRGDLDENI